MITQKVKSKVSSSNDFCRQNTEMKKVNKLNYKTKFNVFKRHKANKKQTKIVVKISRSDCIFFCTLKKFNRTFVQYKANLFLKYKVLIILTDNLLNLNNFD